jgi:hypothetical protein
MRLLLIAVFGVLALSISGCASEQASREAFAQKLREDSARINARGDAYLAKAIEDGETYRAGMQRRLESYTPIMRKYFACNKNASRIVSTQSGDPGSLAVAARILCSAAEIDLQNAINAAYSNDPSFGLQTMEKIRKLAVETNIGSIVAFRIKGGDKSEHRPAPLPNPGQNI